MKLWQETIKEDGTSSLKDHKIRSVWKGCLECNFEPKNARSRILVCKTCGNETTINYSTHDLKNGRIIPNTK